MKLAKYVGAIMLMPMIGCLLAGCVSQDALDKDPMVVVRQAREAGLKGRLIIVYGGGHIMGQAFNLSGSSGFLEIEIDPNMAE